MAIVRCTQILKSTHNECSNINFKREFLRRLEGNDEFGAAAAAIAERLRLKLNGNGSQLDQGLGVNWPPSRFQHRRRRYCAQTRQYLFEYCSKLNAYWLRS